MITNNQPIIKAILGPTNTGKTYYAIDRMLSYKSGIMCFPLRLLARENYDKIISKINKEKVALITGEEKIIPPKACFFCCTIESMPTDIKVEFLGMDEIQISGDFERGHVFTSRILHSRGLKETLFLGAGTIANKLKILVPNIKIEGRPRMSSLSYSGRKKVTRLQKRSAIVAFSISEVYTIADIIRKQLGGAAIVMGALSPRTRNAQVEMYENGDVDYLVATDAIGMGLNLKIDHVRFASLRKFDGHNLRYLSDPEIGQIAGRAGRFLSDGTFGVTENASEMSLKTIDSVENSNFDSLDKLFWRNSNLNFSSINSLKLSLEEKPPFPFLFRKSDAEDHKQFLSLAEIKNVKKLTNSEFAVNLLWEVSQVPEFSKSLTNDHIQLLSRIFEVLITDGLIQNEFISKQINRLDRITGDIDTLMQRISLIRTWTYLSHKKNWLSNADNWKKTSLAIEDKLSDALNNELTKRFVDKRVMVLGKSIKDSEMLSIEIKTDGTLFINEMEVGQLRGFHLNLLDTSTSSSPLFLKNLKKVLSKEITNRVKTFYSITDESLSIDNEGKIYWDLFPVGWLVSNNNPYLPRVQVITSDLLEVDHLNLIEERLSKFLDNALRKIFSPIVGIQMDDLEPASRGIIYQVKEGFGSTSIASVSKLLQDLTEEQKKMLGKIGLRFGVEFVYIPELLKPAAVKLRALLWGLLNNSFPKNALPEPGRVAFEPVTIATDHWYNIIGYSRLGDRVMRIDMVERLCAIIRISARNGSFNISDEMLSIAGASREQMLSILFDLGYIKIDSENEKDNTVTFQTFFKKNIQKKIKYKKINFKKSNLKTSEKKPISKANFTKNRKKRVGDYKKINHNSPFAILSSLKLNK